MKRLLSILNDTINGIVYFSVPLLAMAFLMLATQPQQNNDQANLSETNLESFENEKKPILVIKFGKQKDLTLEDKKEHSSIIHQETDNKWKEEKQVFENKAELPITDKKQQVYEDKLEALFNAYENEQISGDEFALQFIIEGFHPDFKINYDNQTLLHYLASRNEIEGVEILIKAGADVNIQDRYGDTPLDYLNSEEKKEVQRLTEKRPTPTCASVFAT